MRTGTPTDVTNMKILGVVVGCDLSARLHISDTLGACSRSFYALRVRRAHGLPPASLQEVARATTLARLLYASSAWWGFAKKEDRNRLESLVKRMRRMGYLPSSTLTLKISSTLRRTACWGPSLSPVTMFCALFSPNLGPSPRPPAETSWLYSTT